MPGLNYAIDLLGAADTGFQWQQLVSAAAEAANRGITYAQEKAASDEAAKGDAAAASAAIDADRKYTDALTEALFTAHYAKNGDPANVAKAAAADALAEQLKAAQEEASAGLSPAASATRMKEARTAAEKAARESLLAASVAAADTKNAAAQMAAVKAKCRADATRVTATKSSASQIMQSPLAPQTAIAPVRSMQSFWTRPVLGPVPGWGVTVGGVGLAGALGWFFLRRK